MASSNGYRILLDGYNVIKRHPVWSRRPLQEAREWLIARAGKAKWPLPVEAVDVYFDAKGAEEARHCRLEGVCVYFVADADAAIQKFIRLSKQPFRLALISEDRQLQHTAKVHGVRVLSAALAGLPALGRRRKNGGSSSSSAAEAVPLTVAQARRITDELARYWLRDEKPF